jgi:hypothetical protein
MLILVQKATMRLKIPTTYNLRSPVNNVKTPQLRQVESRQNLDVVSNRQYQ